MHHSPTPSSSAASSASLHSLRKAKTKKRASKPKVRTGCLTCKARRVKCGEEKPSCLRCTSTGRRCEGYESSRHLSPSPRLSEDPADWDINKKLTTRRLLEASALLDFRPLAADISGSEKERLYFHLFRQISDEEVGVRHSHNDLFWKQVVPEYCHGVDAVKHAFIAFGAAYHHFRRGGEQPDRDSPPSDVERFVIAQYNLSMRELNKTQGGLSGKILLSSTLMCCVAFYCIEICRNEYLRAKAHLRHGLRLLRLLSVDTAAYSRGPNPKDNNGQLVDNTYHRVRYLLKLLAHWEVTARFYHPDSDMPLTSELYETRKFDWPEVADVASPSELHDVVDDFCQDVYAFVWQLRGIRPEDDSFWTDKNTQIQYATLQKRRRDIGTLFEDFRNCPSGVGFGSPEYITFFVSKLHYRGMSLSLSILPVLQQGPQYTSPAAELARFEECLSMAAPVQAAQGKRTGSMKWISVDFQVIPALHTAASKCRDQVLRQKVADTVRKWPGRESAWSVHVVEQATMSTEYRTLANAELERERSHVIFGAMAGMG